MRSVSYASVNSSVTVSVVTRTIVTSALVTRSDSETDTSSRAPISMPASANAAAYVIDESASMRTVSPSTLTSKETSAALASTAAGTLGSTTTAMAISVGAVPDGMSGRPIVAPVARATTDAAPAKWYDLGYLRGAGAGRELTRLVTSEWFIVSA